MMRSSNTCRRATAHGAKRCSTSRSCRTTAGTARFRRTTPATRISACRTGANGRASSTRERSSARSCTRRASCTSARSATRNTPSSSAARTTISCTTVFCRATAAFAAWLCCRSRTPQPPQKNSGAPPRATAWSAAFCRPKGCRGRSVIPSTGRSSRKRNGSGRPFSIHSCTSLRDNDRFLEPNEVAALAHVIPQMRQFTNIMISGLMNNLKRLRLGFLEAGCGWVPYLISKIEERLERISPKERPVLPSVLLARRQLYFQCGEEMTVKRDVELLGDSCLLWASDFPHEATKTDLNLLVREFVARKDLGSASKKKILYDNPKRFYAL